MTSGQLPVPRRSLIAAQYGDLADVPPEIEWLANITNPKHDAPTKRMWRPPRCLNTCRTIEAKALDKARCEVTNSIRQTDIERLSKLANAVGKGGGDNPDPYSFIRNVTWTATKE